MCMYHHMGKNIEETLASHRLKSQAISTMTVPPKIENLEELAITRKEAPSLSFLCHQVALLEFKPSSQYKYKNNTS